LKDLLGEKGKRKRRDVVIPVAGFEYWIAKVQILSDYPRYGIQDLKMRMKSEDTGTSPISFQ
jgi:hypothetical protein